MSNIDNRIANADQILTTDIDKFCESTVDLYSNTCKPLLDVFIYLYRTTMNIGFATPMYIVMYLLFSGVVLTHLRRPTGSLTIQEQKLEGEYRFVNSRVSFFNLCHLSIGF
jgi:ATP-binding cassette subfamily D (ALD) protein 3